MVNRIIIKVQMIICNHQIIIYGEGHEIIKEIIMIIEIKNILDSDHVQKVIMFQVNENGVN
jgi:hypothetical protein